MGTLNVFFVSNGIIKFKILENDPLKSVAHGTELKKMFPDIYIDNFSFVCRE